MHVCLCSFCLPKGHVLTVHPRGSREGDVELRVVGVAAVVDHSQDPARIVFHRKTLVCRRRGGRRGGMCKGVAVGKREV